MTPIQLASYSYSVAAADLKVRPTVRSTCDRHVPLPADMTHLAGGGDVVSLSLRKPLAGDK